MLSLELFARGHVMSLSAVRAQQHMALTQRFICSILLNAILHENMRRSYLKAAYTPRVMRVFANLRSA